MQYKIIHETEYLFDKSVFLEPHYLRFRARSSPQQKLKSFDLYISPQVAGIRAQLDAENNEIHFCWFEGLHQKLHLKATSLVEILDFNPFNFILHPANVSSLPFAYAEDLQKSLFPYLQTMELSPALIDYSHAILKEAQSNTSIFINLLSQRIHKDFSIIYRETGPPLSPSISFEKQQGSCRDLAWMQIQVLRHFGMAARFVSGYFYLDQQDVSFELHAWLEVFLPGAGWLGFDPTHGIATASAHIPLVASAYPRYTMPLSGTIRGDATASMNTHLDIRLTKE